MLFVHLALQILHWQPSFGCSLVVLCPFYIVMSKITSIAQGEAAAAQKGLGHPSPHPVAVLGVIHPGVQLALLAAEHSADSARTLRSLSMWLLSSLSYPRQYLLPVLPSLGPGTEPGFQLISLVLLDALVWKHFKCALLYPASCRADGRVSLAHSPLKFGVLSYSLSLASLVLFLSLSPFKCSLKIYQSVLLAPVQNAFSSSEKGASHQVQQARCCVDVFVSVKSEILHTFLVLYYLIRVVVSSVSHCDISYNS